MVNIYDFALQTVAHLSCPLLLQASPQSRVLEVSEAVHQTLWWRAPEVLFGAQGFDQSADIWSLGLVLAEMAGFRFQDAFQKKTASEVGYAMAVFHQLGTPTCPELTQLPRWPAKCPKFPGQPWPADVRRCLGSAGIALLARMLAWTPPQRPRAEDIGNDSFVAPWRFPLYCTRALRNSFYQGQRHPWNVCMGIVAVEVLEWLREDSALTPGSPEFLKLAVDFNAKRKDAKSEENRKCILAGSLGEACGTNSMCGLSIARALPVPRLQAWRAAFLAVNEQAFGQMDREVKAQVRRLEAEHIGENGEHFLSLPFGSWFASCGELTFTEAGCEEQGFWAEPEHQDGGASVMHLAFTLYGRRRLTCRQTGNLEDVAFVNVPGTVYLGQLTGPRHQVTHEKGEPDEYLEVPGLGRCSVAVMMRTALFPKNRARLRDTSPSPRPLFEVLHRCFREALAEMTILLPSLPACLSHMPH